MSLHYHCSIVTTPKRVPFAKPTSAHIRVVTADTFPSVTLALAREHVEYQIPQRRFHVSDKSADLVRQAMQPRLQLRTFHAYDDDAGLAFLDCYVMHDRSVDRITVLYRRREHVALVLPKRQ